MDNDVGRIRSILMHRPGPEMQVVDATKRLAEIGSFGDLAVGWYFQSDTPPPLPLMQSQHDALSRRCGSRGRGSLHEGRGRQPAEAAATPAIR